MRGGGQADSVSFVEVWHTLHPRPYISEDVVVVEEQAVCAQIGQERSWGMRVVYLGIVESKVCRVELNQRECSGRQRSRKGTGCLASSNIGLPSARTNTMCGRGAPSSTRNAPHSTATHESTRLRSIGTVTFVVSHMPHT